MKIYLAGGWFTPEQEELHTRIAQFLNEHYFNSYDVFNPKLASKGLTNFNENHTAEKILIDNIENIKRSDIILAIYDYKDTGTLWECGYAYANQKPIIYYSETLGNKGFNIMLAKTGYFVKNIQELNNLLANNIYFGNIEFKNVYDFGGKFE